VERVGRWVSDQSYERFIIVAPSCSDSVHPCRTHAGPGLVLLEGSSADDMVPPSSTRHRLASVSQLSDKGGAESRGAQ